MPGNSSFTTDAKVGSESGFFDGIGARVDIPATDLSGQDKLTVSAWVKANDITTSANTQILRQNTGCVAPNVGFPDFYIGFQTNGTTMSFATHANGAYSEYRASSISNMEGQWHFVTAVYDGAEKYIYVNGVERPQTSGSKNIVGNLDNRCTGATIASNNNAERLDGQLDDVAIYKAALTPQEISLIYNRQKQKYAGHYESPIIDTGSTSASWTAKSLVTELPFMKELPGSAGSESSADYASLVGSTGSTSDNNLMSGLVGLWHFNETSGTSVIDSSNSILTGNLNGVTLGKQGELGQAILFDGVDDYIEIVDPGMNSPLDFDLNDEITIAGWIKPNEIGVAQEYIIGKGRLLGGGTDQNWGLRIQDNDSDGFSTLTFIYRDSTNSNFHVWYTQDYLVIDNSWNHITFSFKFGDGSTAKAYLNGLDVSTGSSWTLGNGNAAPIVNNSNVWIGSALGPADTSSFNGEIDELGLWDRALRSEKSLNSTAEVPTDLNSK